MYIRSTEKENIFIQYNLFGVTIRTNKNKTTHNEIELQCS